MKIMNNQQQRFQNNSDLLFSYGDKMNSTILVPSIYPIYDTISKRLFIRPNFHIGSSRLLSHFNESFPFTYTIMNSFRKQNSYIFDTIESENQTTTSASYVTDFNRITFDRIDTEILSNYNIQLLPTRNEEAFYESSDLNDYQNQINVHVEKSNTAPIAFNDTNTIHAFYDQERLIQLRIYDADGIDDIIDRNASRTYCAKNRVIGKIENDDNNANNNNNNTISQDIEDNVTKSAAIHGIYIHTLPRMGDLFEISTMEEAYNFSFSSCIIHENETFSSLYDYPAPNTTKINRFNSHHFNDNFQEIFSINNKSGIREVDLYPGMRRLTQPLISYKFRNAALARTTTTESGDTLKSNFDSFSFFVVDTQGQISGLAYVEISLSSSFHLIPVEQHIPQDNLNYTCEGDQKKRKRYLNFYGVNYRF